MTSYHECFEAQRSAISIGVCAPPCSAATKVALIDEPTALVDQLRSALEQYPSAALKPSSQNQAFRGAHPSRPTAAGGVPSGSFQLSTPRWAPKPEGNTCPPLPIGEGGSALVTARGQTLLVALSCSTIHLGCRLALEAGIVAQYIPRTFGADSNLRQHELRLAWEETAKGEQGAVVAVARKLAVLLLICFGNPVILSILPHYALKRPDCSSAS
jgi:hypothetical protein